MSQHEEKDTKGLIRNRNAKDRKYNNKKTKDGNTNSGPQNTMQKKQRLSQTNPT